MSTDAVLDDVSALGRLLDEAAEALMAAAEDGMNLARCEPIDRAAISAGFAGILQLCAFHDLAGQRLRRIAEMLSNGAADTRPDAALLHGPANGDGLDQDQADALFRAV